MVVANSASEPIALMISVEQLQSDIANVLDGIRATNFRDEASSPRSTPRATDMQIPHKPLTVSSILSSAKRIHQRILLESPDVSWEFLGQVTRIRNALSRLEIQSKISDSPLNTSQSALGRQLSPMMVDCGSAFEHVETSILGKFKGIHSGVAISTILATAGLDSLWLNTFEEKLASLATNLESTPNNLRPHQASSHNDGGDETAEISATKEKLDSMLDRLARIDQVVTPDGAASGPLWERLHGELVKAGFSDAVLGRKQVINSPLESLR